MTDSTRPPKPTDSELDILHVLWQRGPSTVRQIHVVLAQSQDTGYTTVLKLLQIMHRKKLVERDDSRRAHVYQPTYSKEVVQQQLTSDLIQRAFDGSPSQLVLQALGNGGGASREDLRKIRSLLNELENAGESNRV